MQNNKLIFNQAKRLIGRIHSIETGGTLDGPGIRYVIFMQGCPLRCKYCHNPDSWKIDDAKGTTVEELIKDIKCYKPFMDFSKGGVTISGGEPLLQKKFLIELFKRLKEENIHTALDTSGYSDLNQETDDLLDQTDFVLLDIKHLDPEAHKKLTGVSNSKIIRFANYLNQRKIRTWIRYVIVGNYTEDLEYATRLAAFVQGFDNVELVELLPYHELGKHKWNELGFDYHLDDILPPDRKMVAKIRDIFESRGIKVLSD